MIGKNLLSRRSSFPWFFILCIIRRCSLFEPGSEFFHRMSQAPFFEYGSRHGGNCTRRFRCAALPRIIQQPFFEGFRIRVVFYCPRQKGSLYRQSNGVGCLIALTLAPASFSSFEGIEQSLANIGGPKRLH